MTTAQVRKILQQIGLRPQRAAGQHFLLPEAVAKQMVRDAVVTKADTVLEIGPGLGLLTDALIATGAKIIAVELDQRLADYLHRRYRAQPNVTVVTGDIFRLNLNDFLADRQYKLVANLPYSSTSLVFRNFLTLMPRPTRLTAMVQLEVAKRITAPPGEMSLLSLMVQYYSQPRLLGDVARSSFWPAPEVTSAVVDCFPLVDRDEAETKALFHLAKAGFASRRKQLVNGLAALPEYSKVSAEKLLVSHGLSPQLRPQELSVADWRKLAKAIL